MEIRDYKRGNESAILKLFLLAFGKEMTMEYWRWRFLDNPFSTDIKIKLMWDKEKLVGHYAVSPINMVIDGHVVKTALSMTTMTHPNYGGKGIFSKLAKSLYQDLKNENYKMVWGFPNNNSHYGFNKNLGWQDIALQGMMSLNINNNFLNKIFNESVEYSVCLSFDDSIVNKLSSSTKAVKIDKTKLFLNWRFIDNPSNKYKIIQHNSSGSIAIYKVIPSFTDSTKNEIDIMEIYCENNIEFLINILSSIYKEERDVIIFNLWDSLFSSNQIILEKVGFRITPPVTYLGYKSLSSVHGSEYDYKNWEINFGYSDVF